MSEHWEYRVPHAPNRQLSEFANSLFGYLYFHLNMHGYRMKTSQNFKEVIGRAVFCIRKDTYKFNIQILDNCGYGVDRFILCEKICSSYPNYDYFKKLYFISAFILDVMFWWHTNSDAVDLSMGPNLWIKIFRNHFENEFEAHGGWQGLAEAGNECCELLPNEILPGETILPTYFQTILAAVKQLVPPPGDDDLNEAIAKDLESLNFARMEIGASVNKTAQIAKTEEEIEENQHEKVAQFEELNEESEENLPEKGGDKSSSHSALGENVVRTENPCEGSSEKSGENAQESFCNRNRRKRRYDAPPQSDSATESDFFSHSKAKVDRK